MHLRCLNEQTLEIEATHVLDVVQSGEKEVFRAILEDGRTIKTSRDHRFYTTEGWQSLEQMVGLEMTSSGRVTISKEAYVYTNGEAAWRSQNWLQERRSQGARVAEMAQEAGTPVLQPIPQVKPYRPLQKLMAKPVKVVKVEYAGREMTYDIAVCGPYHNYIANGFVVHNSYNERSGRYVEYEDEFYVPERLRLQAKSNKQASEFGEIPNEPELVKMIQETYDLVYERYEKLLAAGVARELARAILPLSLYTQFYWTINARALMNFINLRADAGAQWEIRQYAEAIAKLFKEKMPWTWEAFAQFVWRGENPAITP
ncbi:FAD-dependent thymidylate synthase [Candidatus Acetothermia bacterium]|nr:FAD-dependent thymidylate synthase [Candidatus Acetothermia bacterium]MCI2431988.1 FAD-dependent thymidylate synthase [Candidatus Acetothermia bacterium]MCI2436785.1 FAD-dependent thymidylate synthase [Candidatus Acetothermia bacterium]